MKLAPSIRRISRFESERPISECHPEFSRVCRVELRAAWPIELSSALILPCSYLNNTYVNTQNTLIATVEAIGGDDSPLPYHRALFRVKQRCLVWLCGARPVCCPTTWTALDLTQFIGRFTVWEARRLHLSLQLQTWSGAATR